MSETTFSVKGNGVGKVRLESTDIIGIGSPANPQLLLGVKFQLQPLGQNTYTLLRVHGKILIGNENQPVATAEHPPFTEESYPNIYDRTVQLSVPLTLTQIKHIEDVRSGNDLRLKLILSGLVAIKQLNEFERLQDMNLDISVPRSHWIDMVLKSWGVSDLRLLEIKFPGESQKEMATARQRLERAEGLYRIGDYSHVLSELRSAFDAITQAYSQKGVGKDAWEELLAHTHETVREKLREMLASFRKLLHLGPHPPMPTPETPTPISRQDARFALIVAHAVFEYFSAENWPGI
jgi:hypothetical protein